MLEPSDQELTQVEAEIVIYHGRIPVTVWGCLVALSYWEWMLRRPLAGREN